MKPGGLSPARPGACRSACRPRAASCRDCRSRSRRSRAFTSRHSSDRRAAASRSPSRAASLARAAIVSSTSRLNRPNWIPCSRPLTASAMRWPSATSKRAPAIAARIAPAISSPPYWVSSSAERALPAAACASRARCAASCGTCSPTAPSTENSASSSSGCSRTIWQRERIVGNSRPSECATRMKSVRAGGSSRLFSSALAALRCSCRRPGRR